MFDEVKAHFRVRQGYWFVPKVFGLGATPVTWQGWAATLVFAGALVAVIRWVPGAVDKIVIGVALFAAFGVLTAYKTYGGLRWRWGADDR